MSIWRPSAAKLAAMSDIALIVRAQRSGPPRALIAVHIAAFLATVGVVVLLIGASPSGGWTRALFLGCMFGWLPGLMVVLTLLGGFDTRYGPVVYERELFRRAGWKPFESHEAEVRELWTSMPGPGWLLLFHGHALPHHDEHFVRVLLFQEEGRDCLLTYGDLRWAASPELHQDPRKRVHLGAGHLFPDERDELLELLAGAEREPLKGWQGDTEQGYPFELLALRRGPGESFQYSGNLSDPDAPSQPRRLAAAMLDIGQRAGAERSRYGIIRDGRLVFIER